MTFENFVKEYTGKGLIRKQKPSLPAAQKLLLRAVKDLKISEANLSIDAGTAYTVAYLAMLRAGRAIMIAKGFRPDDGAQHKTVVEFSRYYLGEKVLDLVEHFEQMRRKRNIFTYDADIDISETEAKNALITATKFVQHLEHYTDAQIAKGRFNDPKSKIISGAKLKKQLGA